jgi:hypothetical protein
VLFSPKISDTVLCKEGFKRLSLLRRHLMSLHAQARQVNAVVGALALLLGRGRLLHGRHSAVLVSRYVLPMNIYDPDKEPLMYHKPLKLSANTPCEIVLV